VELLKSLESKRLADLQKSFGKLENDLKVMRPRGEYLENEIVRIQ
jgi:hypothetical protein